MSSPLVAVSQVENTKLPRKKKNPHLLSRSTQAIFEASIPSEWCGLNLQRENWVEIVSTIRAHLLRTTSAR